MIYVLEIDNETPAGKCILKEAERARKGVTFLSPAAIKGVPPEGHMTGVEGDSSDRSNMISILKIDDNTPAGKRILKEAKEARKGVKFRSPVINGVPPEGYMTGEEFYEEGLKIINKICRKYGLLE